MQFKTLLLTSLILFTSQIFAQTVTTEHSTQTTTITTQGLGLGLGIQITDDYGHRNNSTTHHHHYDNRPPVYVSNYSGRVGCPVPQNNIQNILQAINSEDFADDKMAVAQQAVRNRCFVAQDIKQIASQFTFADDKLAFSKFAYYSTYDIDNYYLLNSIFEFSDDKAALNAFINQQ